MMRPWASLAVAGAVAAAVALAGGCGPSAGVSPSVVPVSVPPPPPAQPCRIVEASGVLPSNRLVDLAVASTSGGSDRLTFHFGPPGGEPAAALGRLREAEPPFHQGGSGQEVRVEGERFVEVRFEGMVVADDSGNAVYRGPQEDKPFLPAVSQVVIIDQFEGVVTFIVGLKGNGCVALGGDPQARTVTVEVAHG